MIVVDKEEDQLPVKAWTSHVKIENEAWQQAKNLAALPFIHKHVALMPDAHWGMGSTVGSVIATKGAVIPAAVGVDIGCGMMALQTNLHANQLPDSLGELRARIEKAIPHGRTNNGKEGDRGAWGNTDVALEITFHANLNQGFINILDKHPKITPHRHPIYHLGTLGTGNHFIELCLDENQLVWVMLHSGSRGIGNKIGNYFIEKAKEEMERWHINHWLPDQDLAYLVEHTELFDDYVYAVEWAQQFASLNRRTMMFAVLNVLSNYFQNPHIAIMAEAVNCHHNYVTRETHFKESVLLTRKGAVNAEMGRLGIIPGSMGAKSYIVRGKGNPESFHSCSHGAGRAMSRGAAKRAFSLEEHIAATEGVECRKDLEVIDETPMAYKDIDAVMKSQEDLVEVVHTLKQFLCVKG